MARANSAASGESSSWLLANWRRSRPPPSTAGEVRRSTNVSGGSSTVAVMDRVSRRDECAMGRQIATDRPYLPTETYIAKVAGAKLWGLVSTVLSAVAIVPFLR